MCHRACRYDEWKRRITKQRGEFVQVTELDSDGKVKPLHHNKEEDRKYMERSWKNFEKDLGELMSKFYTSKMKMAVKSDTNFRDDFYADYKDNRKRQNAVLASKGETRGRFIDGVRRLAVANDYAVEAIGMEADDYVRIWAEEHRAANEPFIVVSIDKDLKCIPGKHYNPQKKELVTVTEDEAMRFYYQQLIQGDPTDNIPGIPGVGPITAAKEIAALKNEAEFQECVVSHYIAAYHDEWYEMLMFNGRLIYILKTLEDQFNCDHWELVKEFRD